MSESKEQSSNNNESAPAGFVNIQGHEIELVSNEISGRAPLEKMYKRGVKLPYVLFEKNALTVIDGKTKAVKRYFELPLDGSHCYPARVQYYLDKGFKIIRFHVPESSEEKKEFRDGMNRNGFTVVLDGQGEEEKDPFGIMLNFLQGITKIDDDRKALENEVKELRKQLTSAGNKPNMKAKE